MEYMKHREESFGYIDYDDILWQSCKMNLGHFLAPLIALAFNKFIRQIRTVLKWNLFLQGIVFFLQLTFLD